MDIGALNQKITIQHATVTTDSIGNKINTWSTYFTCFATISGEDSSLSSEDKVAGQTVENGKTSFTVRYCSELANLDSLSYRISFNGDLYDITGINHLSYKNKALKLMCKRCRR